MKTITKIILIAFVMMVCAINTFAQVTKTATATATIVSTIELEKVVDMDFGNLAVTTVGGPCVLSPTSPATRDVTGGGVTLPAVPGTVTAADFLVTGVANYHYAIVIPTTDLIITNTTGLGGETMIVNAFTSIPTVALGGTIDILTGNQTLYVGATVNVLAGQEPGIYVSATPFDVTVNYD